MATDRRASPRFALAESLLYAAPMGSPSSLLRLVFLVATSVACGPPPPPVYVPANYVERSALAQPIPTEAIRAAIVQTLNERRCTVQGEEPGLIRAALRHRRAEVSVDIVYESTGYELRTLHVAGLPTIQDEAGQSLVDDSYVRIVRRYRKLIDRNLVRAEAELEEREEDARDHELAVAQAHAREAEAEREQAAIERMPVPAPSPAVAGGSGSALQAGFNVVRAPNGMGAAQITIRNEGADPLRFVAFRSSGAGQWRANQLSYTVTPGQEYTVTGIAPGTYELRVETHNAYKEWRPLQVGAGGVYTLVVTTQGWFRL